MALDIDPGSGFDVTLHCSQYSTIKNKTMTLRNRAFLSELLGKTAATVQNKRDEKEPLWLILLMSCYTNVTVWSLSPIQVDSFE